MTAQLPITAPQGQVLWDTREVPGGVYTIELYNAGGRVESQRLVVQPAR